jgi:hypothetical protein
MREDITKVTDEEIGPIKKREIIKQKLMIIQMIIIKRNTTIIENTIINILDRIEIVQKTDIINDFALFKYSAISYIYSIKIIFF